MFIPPVFDTRAIEKVDGKIFLPGKMKNYLNQNLKMNLYMETCESFSDRKKFAGFNWFRLNDITLFLRLAFHVSERLSQLLYYFREEYLPGCVVH